LQPVVRKGRREEGVVAELRQMAACFLVEEEMEDQREEERRMRGRPCQMLLLQAGDQPPASSLLPHLPPTATGAKGKSCQIACKYIPCLEG
jgi:hypothetical protein